MSKMVRLLCVTGFLSLGTAAFAQYTMDLWGTGDGASANGVYVSPYQGSIWSGAYSGGSTPTSTPLYSGYVICDDYVDESYVGDVWNATATNAGSIGSSVLFQGGYTDPNADPGLWTANTHFTAQQSYDAVAYLANELLLPANLTNSTNQTNISFAIWDIMDANNAGDPDGGAAGYITQAFAAVEGGYVGSNVTVYTPAPAQGAGNNVSQEFLVVTPEPSSVVILALDLLGVLGVVYLVRRRRAKA